MMLHLQSVCLHQLESAIQWLAFRERVEQVDASGLEMADIARDDGEAVFQRSGGNEEVRALVS